MNEKTFENKDELFEFPTNYEQIANYELKKLDKDYLITNSFENKKPNINVTKENQVINIEDELDNNKDNLGEEEENGEVEDNNKYVQLEEDDEIIDNNNNETKNNDKQENDEKSIENIKIEMNDESVKNQNEQIKNEVSSGKLLEKNNKIIIKDPQKMKEMISRFNFPKPKWAENLSDEDIINKLKKLMNKKEAKK